jgi:hypothetical protein
MSPDDGPAYVAAVLMRYVDRPDTPLRAGPRDQWLARKLHDDTIPLTVVGSALLLGSLRRLVRPADLPPPCRSALWLIFSPSSPNCNSSYCQMATSITFGSNCAIPLRQGRMMFKNRRFQMIANTRSQPQNHTSKKWAFSMGFIVDEWHPSIRQLSHLRPGEMLLLAPMDEHRPPEPDDPIAKRGETVDVSRYCVVVEVALQDRSKPFAVLHNRFMDLSA